MRMTANVKYELSRMKIQKNKILYLLSFLVLIIIDQLSKYIVRSSGGFYICNTNLAIGIKPINFLIFLFILIFILFLFKIGNHKSQITNHKQILSHRLIRLWRKNLNNQNSNLWFGNFNFENYNLFRIWNLEFGALILIFSGGISNIIDRLQFGCVIDFIDLKFWPIFNLADIYITIGVIILITQHITCSMKQKSIS
jgi:lipoprotein signal peptidase